MDFVAQTLWAIQNALQKFRRPEGEVATSRKAVGSNQDDEENSRKESAKPYTLPLFLERVLDVEWYGDIKILWRQVNVPQAGKKQFLERVFPIVKAQIRLYGRRGPRGQLQRAFLNLKDIRRLYRGLQLTSRQPKQLTSPNRPANRFTGQGHATVAKELEAVEQWREEELRYNQTLREAYNGSSRDDFSFEDAQSLGAAKRQLATSDLKLEIAARYIQTLRFEAQSDTRGDTNTESLISIPEDVLHHVFEDIVNAFKECMFDLGCRDFPEIMKSKDWDMAEKINLTNFIEVMVTRADLKERFAFFEDEFRSLTAMRNAHAHASTDFDVRQVGELLADAIVVAKALGFHQLEHRTSAYQVLVEDYRKNALLSQVSVEEDTARRFRTLERNAEHQEEVLDKEEVRLQERRKEIQVRRNGLQQECDQRREVFLERAKMAVHDKQRALAGPLNEFALERLLHRIMNAVPLEKRAQFAEALWSHYRGDGRSDPQRRNKGTTSDVLESDALPSPGQRKLFSGPSG
ncbi:hypothetical protein BDW02DRAFT_601503 [Decorospora gaudefroyi]|uniref:Uncharacterized protein n=1 Tax=Decorospora gaudefroyi TaxID=184978 RepID=A0A6A5KBE8_9PLEO|nr:hypothetical protein BDW02DRAFT_601503 [Decorospora gaudefroyi]